MDVKDGQAALFVKAFDTNHLGVLGGPFHRLIIWIFLEGGP